MSWGTFEHDSGPVHVIPLDDLREHIECVDCLCRPDLEDGGRIVIHRAWDGREITERAIDYGNEAGSMN